MAINRITADVEVVQSLSDKPNEVEGLTPDQMKKKLDDDAINLKTDLNTNVIPQIETELERALTGWYPVTESVTFASVDNPTGVVYFSGDVTTKYTLGNKLKMTNGGNVIYAKITAISTYDLGNDRTTITFLHEINYPNNTAVSLLANSAITNIYFSNIQSPFGFPMNSNSWSTISTNSFAQQTSPTASTVYNLGGNYVLPIGVWKVEISTNFFVEPGTTIANGCKIWVASTNSSSSAITNKFSAQHIPGSQSRISSISFLISDIDTVTSKTTRFINILTFDSSYTRIGIGINENINIKATCAY